MPAKDRLRLDEEHGTAPSWKEPREQDEQTALMAAKTDALDAARSDDELLAQKRVLDDKFRARSGQVGDNATGDARRPARLPERVHRPRCQPGSRRGKLEPEDASHWRDRSESANDHQVLFCGESQAIVRRRREVASTTGSITCSCKGGRWTDRTSSGRRSRSSSDRTRSGPHHRELREEGPR